MDRLWGTLRSIEDKWLSSAADSEVFEASGHRFRAIHTPGHAQHHIAWALEDLIFTGDVAGIRIKDGPVVAPCPPPDLDIVKWEASMDRLAQSAPSALYLTHFGCVNRAITTHLDALRAQLRAIVSWVEEQVATHPEEASTRLEERLKQRTIDQIQALGYGHEVEEAYLGANPPFMSVLGIRRYLSKLRD